MHVYNIDETNYNHGDDDDDEDDEDDVDEVPNRGRGGRGRGRGSTKASRGRGKDSRSANNKANKKTNYHHQQRTVGPRLLTMVLTDGVDRLKAAEYEPLRHLSPDIPIGTKVKLIPPLDVCMGVVLLRRGTIELLGGPQPLPSGLPTAEPRRPANIDIKPSSYSSSISTPLKRESSSPCSSFSSTAATINSTNLTANKMIKVENSSSTSSGHHVFEIDDDDEDLLNDDCDDLFSQI